MAKATKKAKKKMKKWAPKDTTKEYKDTDNKITAASITTFNLSGYAQW